MPLQITNTLSGVKELFVPLGDPVRMYVCGMTPKDKPHAGHAFMFVQMDMIRRTLEYRGYRVRHVQNFTDVDDKIINRAKALGRDPLDFAREQTEAYFDVMDRLRVRRAHVFPTVSERVAEIIAAIQDLIAKGHAYATSQGVYFEVDTFPGYGKLSHRTDEDVEAGARVEPDPEKRNPRDFALWKQHKTGEIFWESPWGPGRPGWHIECSSMIRHTLGEQIDLHGGGADLIFPHHENEIAQAEAATGREPFVKYWVHSGLMLTGGEKMAHSLGNFTTVESLLQTYAPDVLRLYFLSVHYRSPLQFTPESIEQAAAGYGRLLGFGRARGRADAGAAEATERLRAALQAARAGFAAAMDDDFNAPRAIGALFDLGRELNRLAPDVVQAEVRAAQDTLVELLGVLGIELTPPEQADGDATAYIELLVAVRTDLRKVNQWQLADRIRAGLASLGVIIEDTPTGTVWRRG